MPTATDTQRELYTSVVQLPEPPEIWTPDGSYRGPTIIDRRKMPVRQTLFQATREAASRYPAMAPLTSGEWFQILLALENEAHDVAEDMVSDSVERTSTLLNYAHGKRRNEWCNGFLIQFPDFDENGNIVRDERRVPKGKYVCEIALPTKTGYVKDMPTECDPFINAIYGMPDARRQLPDYAYHYAYLWLAPDDIRNLLRGYWCRLDRECRRVDVDGRGEPSLPDAVVASRVGGQMGTVSVD